MPILRRSAAARRPMARRRGLPVAELGTVSGACPDGPAAAVTAPRRLAAWASPARIGMAAVATVLAAITIVGALSPSPVAGGAGSSATASGMGTSTAASTVGAAWGGSGGLDILDLVTKGGLVLILLFVTLRVLGRMQATGPRRSGRLNVLESRSLASKASLHLVAIGDRRLVVGLTPNGMVALAELDAAELEDARTDESPAEEDATGASRVPRTGVARTGVGLSAAPFGSTLNSLMAPIDGLTDRLAGFFNGGRGR